jgi:hypothetical protein
MGLVLVRLHGHGRVERAVLEVEARGVSRLNRDPGERGAARPGQLDHRAAAAS